MAYHGIGASLYRVSISPYLGTMCQLREKIGLPLDVGAAVILSVFG